jgi:hypothetical protein
MFPVHVWNMLTGIHMSICHHHICTTGALHVSSVGSMSASLEQAGLFPASKYILLRHPPFSRTTVYGSEVFFVDIRQASTVAALDLISVRCF